MVNGVNTLHIRGSCKQSHTYHCRVFLPETTPLVTAKLLLHPSPHLLPRLARPQVRVRKGQSSLTVTVPIAYHLQFQVLLTLFSKSFSPFPHGTCVLSVSHRYLALDGNYHLLKAALPSNPTLRRHLVRGEHVSSTGVLPSVLILFSIFQHEHTLRMPP